MFLKLQPYRSRLFFVFLICLVIGYFGKDSYKSIGAEALQPEVFLAPAQTLVAKNDIIAFQKDGFSYKITPLYDYSISGLVVHKMDYNKWYSLSRTDETFTTDVCMLWGDNLKNGAYQNKTLSIKQDFRFCLFSYRNGTPIANEALSNNHLIISDSAVKKIMDGVSAGDQIRIIGKLINVHAESTGVVGKYEPKTADWRTSTTRVDSGAGACEIIYVEKIEILKKGNVAHHALYSVGKYGLICVTLWFFIQLFQSIFPRPEQQKNSRDAISREPSN